MPPPQLLDDHAGRRLRALRVLLDDDTPTDLEKRLAAAGVRLSASRIKDIEAPRRPRRLWDYEAEQIAEACGVPAAYFTCPLDRLGY